MTLIIELKFSDELQKFYDVCCLLNCRVGWFSLQLLSQQLSTLPDGNAVRLVEMLLINLLGLPNFI